MEDNINYASENEEDEDERLPILMVNYRRSAFGRIRTLQNIGKTEWILIFLSFVVILTDLGFTLFRMVTVDPGPGSDQFIFAILVLINLAFASYYIVHGILQEQPFEILTYIFTTLLIAIFVTINFASGADNMVRMIRFIVTVLLSIPTVALSCKTGWHFWKSGPFVFKTVGGDRMLQRICRTYLFGLSLLIFDAQIMISMTCASLVMMTNEEIFLFISGTIFTGIWLMLGYVGMRIENTKITCLFALASIIQPLYVLYRFVQSLEQIEKPYSIRTNFFLVGGGIILLLVHFTFLAVLTMIAANYGKGLKEAIYGAGSSRVISPAVGSRVSFAVENNQTNQDDYDAITPAD